MDDICPGRCIRVSSLLNCYNQMNSFVQILNETFFKTPDTVFMTKITEKKPTMK